MCLTKVHLRENFSAISPAAKIWNKLKKNFSQENNKIHGIAQKSDRPLGALFD